MITSALLNLVYWLILLVSYPIRQLSDVALPAGVAAALSQAGAELAIINAIFPVSTLIAVILAVLGVEAGYFTYKLIRWVYKKIPGIS
jgi:hypothetical protein